MKLLLGPGEGIDPGEEVDGVLGAGGEGAPGLFDQFEEDRGDTDLFREVGLSEVGDLADGMEWMDFGWDPSGSAGFVNLHLTKDTCIYYISNMNDELNLNPTESTSTGWQNQQYLTREQVAEFLQVSTRTVSEMTTKGIIVAIKLGTVKNSTTRYRKESLEAALKRLEGW